MSRRSLVLHAGRMVGRTLRSYAMLSVTILLSFSFLLGYLVFTDSQLHNSYKDVLHQDRHVVSFTGSGIRDPRMDAVLRETQKAGQTHQMKLLYAALGEEPLSLEDGSTLMMLPQAYFLPSQAWALYDQMNGIQVHFMEVEWLDGQPHETVHLEGNQVIMERSMYEILGLGQMERPQWDLLVRFLPDREDPHGPEKTTRLSVEVVGLIDTEDGQPRQDEVGDYSFCPVVYFPMSRLQTLPETLRNRLGYSWYEVYYTDAPEVAAGTAKGMNITAFSIYQRQNAALEQIRTEKGNKAVIAAAMLILLGINLYSSFRNALNDRKFEIGVKRAIGASSWSIVRQFLYESVMVMLANILLSVVLVADVALAYKFVLSRMPGRVEQFGAWTIVISPYSAGMFVLCAVSLTVVFSLIFAYQSTQVEIVQYLKAE